MKPKYPTELPLGYDDQVLIFLTPNNEIMLRHPIMPTLIYDETVMRYVEVQPVEVKTHE